MSVEKFVEEWSFKLDNIELADWVLNSTQHALEQMLVDAGGDPNDFNNLIEWAKRQPNSCCGSSRLDPDIAYYSDGCSYCHKEITCTSLGCETIACVPLDYKLPAQCPNCYRCGVCNASYQKNDPYGHRAYVPTSGEYCVQALKEQLRSRSRRISSGRRCGECSSNCSYCGDPNSRSHYVLLEAGSYCVDTAYTLYVSQTYSEEEKSKAAVILPRFLNLLGLVYGFPSGNGRRTGDDSDFKMQTTAEKLISLIQDLVEISGVCMSKDEIISVEPVNIIREQFYMLNLIMNRRRMGISLVKDMKQYLFKTLMLQHQHQASTCAGRKLIANQIIRCMYERVVALFPAQLPYDNVDRIVVSLLRYLQFADSSD